MRAKSAGAGRPAAHLPIAALLPIAELLAFGVLAAPAALAGQGACELRLDPREAPVQEAAVLASVRATADPGELRSVEVPPRSGVVVVNAAPAPDRDEVVARMALDTSRASPGEWDVLLRGSARDCRGTLAVVEGGG